MHHPISHAGRRMLDRRTFLQFGGTGLGSVALATLLHEQRLLAASPIRPGIDPARPFAPRPPHFAAKAKNVVVVFCSGALSHVDSFDYKPELFRLHDTPMPTPGGEKLITFQGEQGNLIKPQWEFLARLNEAHLAAHPGDTDLAARISAYELAAKMQLSAARIADLRDETAATLALYGADDTQNALKARFARNCILARRLVEKGVRFVQLFNGAYAMGEGVGNWDGHKSLVKQYSVHGPILDQPVAGLLRDLKDRGLLADTLVAFVTEFGRMPTFQKGASGRDHNPAGFTVWLAGAGVKRAFSHGATDDFGYKAVENVATIYDLHATILHLLGLDHTRLSFYNNGIERRLTDVHGHVIEPILA